MNIQMNEQKSMVLLPDPKQSEIERLFEQWLRVRDCDTSRQTEAEREADFQLYCDLQDQITTLDPTSVKDLAIQFFVETNSGDSDYRDIFFSKISGLALH